MAEDLFWAAIPKANTALQHFWTNHQNSMQRLSLYTGKCDDVYHTAVYECKKKLKYYFSVLQQSIPIKKKSTTLASKYSGKNYI